MYMISFSQCIYITITVNCAVILINRLIQNRISTHWPDVCVFPDQPAKHSALPGSGFTRGSLHKYFLFPGTGNFGLDLVDQLKPGSYKQRCDFQQLYLDWFSRIWLTVVCLCTKFPTVRVSPTMYLAEVLIYNEATVTIFLYFWWHDD